MSGEAESRAHLGLPGKQFKLLQAVVATGKPVVLIVFSGRPLALPWEAEHVAAILEAWFPGVQAGPALARTLCGDVNPSGRLTATFPRSVGQMPLYYNTFSTGRPSHGKDRYVTGYIDELNTPLFPFGWGLSYTKFEYSPTRISTQRISAAELERGGAITVEATVTNSGPRGRGSRAALYVPARDQCRPTGPGVERLRAHRPSGGRGPSREVFARQEGTRVLEHRDEARGRAGRTDHLGGPSFARRASGEDRDRR